jgi:hypothetical protein
MWYDGLSCEHPVNIACNERDYDNLFSECSEHDVLQ